MQAEACCDVKNEFPGDSKIQSQALLAGASINDLSNNLQIKSKCIKPPGFPQQFWEYIFSETLLNLYL